MVGLKPGTLQDFTTQVSHPVAEIPTPPLYMAGQRLNDMLVDLLTEACVDMCNSVTVTGVTSTDGVITTMMVTRAEGSNNIKIDTVIDTAGGFASDSLTRDSYMALHKAISELPLFAPPAAEKIGIHLIGTRQRILVERLLSSGIMIDEKMQALHSTTKDSELDVLTFENLYIIGETLDGANPASEVSRKGLALGLMFEACETINAGEEELK